jgi:glutathione synthase/RimK-type ligase-like ATP-grasp enzyme
VLVVSTHLDTATDDVARALGGAGIQVTRWDTEQYPFGTNLTTTVSPLETAAPTAWIVSPDRSRHPLNDVTAVWFRRVRAPERPAQMDPGVYDFCLREGRAALVGTLLAALPVATRWMSDPRAVWAAELKLYQLATARRAGLMIPETVVTNEAEEVRAAFERFGGAMIAKPVRTGYVEVEGEPFAIYTSRVLAEHLESLEGASLSPVIYQPLLEKRCDVRVTIVGSRIFAAEIDSQSDPAASVDWRQTENPDLPHAPIHLPRHVAEAALRLMRMLELEFGALDFVRTPNDSYVFLEVNPNGQWLWLDDRLDLGITGTMVDWLAHV